VAKLVYWFVCGLRTYRMVDREHAGEVERGRGEREREKAVGVRMKKHIWKSMRCLIWKSIALISLLSKLCHVLSGANITGKLFLCYLRPSYNIFLVRSASDFVRLLSSWCITRLVGKPRCSPHGRRRSSLRARLQRVDDGSNPGDKEKRAHTLGKSEDTVSQLEDQILVTIKALPPIRNVSVQTRVRAVRRSRAPACTR